MSLLHLAKKAFTVLPLNPQASLEDHPKDSLVDLKGSLEVARDSMVSLVKLIKSCHHLYAYYHGHQNSCWARSNCGTAIIQP